MIHSPISPLIWQDPLASLHAPCVFLLLMGELVRDSIVLLMLGYSPRENHSRETEPTTSVMEMVGGWSFQLLYVFSLTLSLGLGPWGIGWGCVN